MNRINLDLRIVFHHPILIYFQLNMYITQPVRFAQNISIATCFVNIFVVKKSKSLQRGDRIYTSESDVCRSQTLTYKDDPRTERIKICQMVVDPQHRYSNEPFLHDLKQPLGMTSIFVFTSALK